MNSRNADFDSGKQDSGSRRKRPESPDGFPPVPIHPAAGLPHQAEGGPPPHPHGHPHLQDEKLRARFELDSAYRDLRKGELIVQQIETYLPDSQEALFGRQLLDIAASIYQSAYKNFQNDFFFKASEYSVSVKDLMRGIDKFYHTAGPYPIYPDAEENKI